MSLTHAWKTPQGSEALKRAVARRIPQWKDGLRDHQQEFIPYILDGDNLLVCTATGDGKSAYFTAPILAHIDVRDDPDSYAGFKAKKKPVGVVITPTIGLASNIVREYHLLLSVKFLNESGRYPNSRGSKSREFLYAMTPLWRLDVPAPVSSKTLYLATNIKLFVSIPSI